MPLLLLSTEKYLAEILLAEFIIFCLVRAALVGGVDDIPQLGEVNVGGYLAPSFFIRKINLIVIHPLVKGDDYMAFVVASVYLDFESGHFVNDCRHQSGDTPGADDVHRGQPDKLLTDGFRYIKNVLSVAGLNIM